jgi:PTS system nitrogen regulatory IIA component
MLVPEHATEQHLNLLSELAQVFSDESLRDALLAERDNTRAHDMLIYGSTSGSTNAAAQRSAAV